MEQKKRLKNKRLNQYRMKDWKILDKEEQIEKIINQSVDKTQVLFKHSVTCGISASANHELENNWEKLKGKVDFYYLDLLKNRSVSNAVATKLRVLHQSPQIIVIKNREVVYTVTHLAIKADKISSFL